MNWGKAKTILIIFFICTNLFLLFAITLSADRFSIVTDDIVNSAISVLKNNRIEIDSETIPRKTQKIPVMNSKNFIEDYETFAKKIAGDDAHIDKTNSYVGTNGVISFDGDYFEFSAYSPLFSENTKKINILNAPQIAENIMKQFGFSDSSAIYSATEEEHKIIVNITRKKDNLYYFNSEINLILTADGMEKIYGTWFFDEKALPDKVELKSVTGVLIDYISLANRPTIDETITALDFGYAILEDGIYHKEAALMPCWRITLGDGGKYILNSADTGNFE